MLVAVDLAKARLTAAWFGTEITAQQSCLSNVASTKTFAERQPLAVVDRADDSTMGSHRHLHTGVGRTPGRSSAAGVNWLSESVHAKVPERRTIGATSRPALAALHLR